MTTPLIEAIAASIRDMPFHDREAYAVTQAALTAITEAGYAVVPVEPSEAMVKAITGSVGFPIRAHRAMISAAQGDG